MIAPTIVIGLGGIGSDICCKVSKLVKDKDQRRRIRFVCIDTDVNDLAQRKQEDSRIITIQTSAPYTIGNYLKTNTRARDFWFPSHNILMGKTPTEGAGQVRAISRLAFDEAVREGRMGALNKAIEELYFLDGAAEPQAVRVMIVSTLVGGTGSGIVLPVALYVRNFLETRFHKSASVVRGFFLLPEIMFGNKSPEEINSLCCNAYASIREMDAFMRRGDGALDPQKYKNLTLELPDVSSGSYVDYHVSPFNFCFLYDKRNTDDKQLMSFVDYKEHAANTIYTQTISGISSRSNSNEDNAIKPLVRSNGRNRFAGAGSSLLKYPMDSVLQYIAGKWCIQNMNEEWLGIDRSYQTYLRDQKQLRKKNPSMPKDQTLAEYYVDQINNSNKGSFESLIYEMCTVVTVDEDGNEEKISKIDQYTIALEKYIKSKIEADEELKGMKADYDALYDVVSKSVNGSANKDDKIKASEMEVELKRLASLGTAYMQAATSAGNRLGRTIAMQLFQSDKDYTNDKSSHRFERYMKDEDEKFIHPNACRYFLYQMLNSFTSGVKNTPGALEDLEEELQPFDDKNTEQIVETAQIYIDQHGKKIRNPFGGKTRREVLSKLETQHDAAQSYSILLAKKWVFESGQTFLASMCEAYEAFYTNFDVYLEETQSEIGEIERKYVNGEGKATRYVCASQRCLLGMLEEMPCSGENMNVNGDLSAQIFHEMKQYAMMVKKPNASLYFEDLYQDKILGFWRGRVMDSHAARIDVDVLTALEMEADYEKDEGLTDDQRRAYAADVLKEAERLAAPFIEETMGEIRHPFTICAYNPKVMGTAESTRRSFVNAHINDTMGGQPDPNVSKYEMMVYKAIYNISAGDLKRFQAPEGNNTKGGEYYAAYLDTIRELGPNPSVNKVLSPHIDRRWHLVKYMPDLDDRNQSILEDNMYRALVWGMLTGKIDQIPPHPEIKDSRFSYQPKGRGKRAQDFVVSNGTTCDELYEVVDALAINPPQIEQILKDYNGTLEREKKRRIELRESKLINCLNWYDGKDVFGEEPCMREEEEKKYPFELPKAEKELHETFTIKQYAPQQKASIYDLIYWIKVSTPVNEFTDSDIEIILESTLKLVEDYVSAYVDKEEVYDVCYRILIDQFILFLQNLMDPAISWPKNRLFDPCVMELRDTIDDRIENVYQMDQEKLGAMDALYSQAVNYWDQTHKKSSVQVKGQEQVQKQEQS